MTPVNEGTSCCHRQPDRHELAHRPSRAERQHRRLWRGGHRAGGCLSPCCQPALRLALTPRPIALSSIERRGKAMRIHNLYVDAKGETHFRDIEVAWVEE